MGEMGAVGENKCAHHECKVRAHERQPVEEQLERDEGEVGVVHELRVCRIGERGVSGSIEGDTGCAMRGERR